MKKLIFLEDIIMMTFACVMFGSAVLFAISVMGLIIATPVDKLYYNDNDNNSKFYKG